MKIKKEKEEEEEKNQEESERFSRPDYVSYRDHILFM